MTVEHFNIEKIAVIGAGPAGLASLNEFLHTSKDGKSTLDTVDKLAELPEEPAFKEIVVFEQGTDIGGTWNYAKEPDSSLPSNVDQYAVPANLRASITPAEYDNATKVSPFISTAKTRNNLWTTSALYDDLYTNVPGYLMRFTAGPVPELDPKAPYYPFLRHPQVLEYLQRFAKAYDLERYVRFNSTVEKVVKDDAKGKWHVTIVEQDLQTGTEKWYTEQFDAVVCAVGRFNTPYVPEIAGLKEFIKTHPDTVLHAKSYRNCVGWQKKKVLIVGSGVSAVDILQYLFANDVEVHLSSNKEELEDKQETKPGKLWTTDILKATTSQYVWQSRIKRLEGDTVEFVDGTVESGFFKIVLATGYHIHYPFLDVPENKGKGYVEVDEGRTSARNKVNNLYQYVFTIGEPTLGHVGLPLSPFLFLVSESNAASLAGVWSNRKSLPRVEEQREWLDSRFGSKDSDFHSFSVDEIKALFAEGLVEYAPEGRVGVNEVVRDFDFSATEVLLKKIFYEIANIYPPPEEDTPK